MNALCWHKESIKGGMTGWAQRYIGRKIGFYENEKWYKHELEKVEGNYSWKILCDFTIQTE